MILATSFFGFTALLLHSPLGATAAALRGNDHGAATAAPLGRYEHQGRRLKQTQASNCTFQVAALLEL